MTSNENKIIIHYFGIFGRSDIIKCLLRHLNKDYSEIIVTQEERAKQEAELVQKGEVFTQLPAIEDGDFTLNDTNPILWYLSEKYGDGSLTGKTPEDRARVKQLEGLAIEVYTSFAKILYSPDWKGGLSKALETPDEGLIGLARRLETYLGQKDFLVGYFTFVDLHLFMIYKMFTDVFKSAGLASPLNSAALYRFYLRIRDEVKGDFGAYLDSAEVKARPYFAPWIQHQAVDVPEGA